MEELTALSPSITFDTKRDFGTSSLRVRGIGTLVLDSGVEPSVATIIDGVVMSQGAAIFNEFPDIERVEVLNGPQGTLFGKNASAGLVNIITKRPNTEEFEAFIKASAAQDDDYRFSFGLSAPITDYLSFRLSGYNRNYDGNILNIVTGNKVNGVEARGIRGKLLFTPVDNFEALLTLDYTTQDAECCQRVLRQDTGNLVYDSDLLASPDWPAGTPFSYAGPRLQGSIADITGLDISDTNNQVAVDREPRNTTENYGFVLEMNWDIFGGHTLTSITGGRKFNTLGTRDNDESPLPLNSLQRAGKDSEWISQEIRLTSPINLQFDPIPGSFDYILGLYLYTATNNNRDSFERIASNSLDGSFDSTPNDDSITHRIQSGFAAATIANRNIAGFGNLNWHLLDNLRLFAGLRVLNEHISGTANGFKGRGYSTEYFASEDRFNGEPVDPERSHSGEIGLRSSWLDNRLKANLTVFYTEIQGFQLTFRDPDTLVNSLNSVPSVTSTGLEVDFLATPLDGLTLRLGFSVTDARFARYIRDEGPDPDVTDGRILRDLSGMTLPNAPLFKMVGSARYERDINHFLGAFVQLGFRYQSEVNYLNDGSGWAEYADQAGFGIVDLSAGISTLDGRYEATIFVKNVGDQFYVIGISPNGNAGGGFVLHALARDYHRYVGGAIQINF